MLRFSVSEAGEVVPKDVYRRLTDLWLSTPVDYSAVVVATQGRRLPSRSTSYIYVVPREQPEHDSEVRLVATFPDLETAIAAARLTWRALV